MNGFDYYMRDVDAECERIAGVVSADLPDQPYFRGFSAGVAPEHMAHRALRAGNLSTLAGRGGLKGDES